MGKNECYYLRFCDKVKCKFKNICLSNCYKNLYQNPKPELVPSSSPSPLSHFLHQLQISITQSFVKLEHFLRPFLKTRSQDESAHTFRSSLRFLEVPLKGFFFMIFLAFVTTFFDMFGLIRSVHFFKSPGSWHECRPIYGLHFVYIGFFPLYKKGGFGGPKHFHHQFLVVFGHQNGFFFKAITLFKTIFEN